ncbi:vulcan [Carabus blaptoides fortunei]
MGKKRKFNRFIRWIKSDLPEDNKSVLLLGVTKIPSPTPVPRARPHTLHLDHHLATKSQTLDSYPRLKPRLFRSHSKDSLNELLAYNRTEVHFNAHNYVPVHEHTSVAVNLPSKLKSDNHGTVARPVAPLTVTATDVKVSDTKFAKKVSFNCNTLNGTDQLGAACFKNGTAASKRLGFCTDLPYDFYHPQFNETSDEATSVPDIIMDKSVDSIGSCSLDVDASSTDFSDSSLGSTDCTLRSLGIPSPTVQQSHTVPSFRLEPSTTIFDAVEPKKPSYLNLACTVNGYSNITNYDSKLRENFRISKSRDVSPIRPQDYHASSRDQNGEPSKFLTPNYTKPLVISPPASNMADSKSQAIYRSSQNSSYSYSSSSTRTMTFMSKETRNFASSMLYNAESDAVDNAANFNPKTNGVQTKFSSFESSKVSQNTYTNVNGKASSTSETSIQENYSNGQQAKSFIQQRVERLYGPGALAQGFFISKRTKNRLSDSENTETTLNATVESSPPQVQQQHDTSLENDSNIKQNSTSPSLPVLRHLRPEFRAQLPILSPKRLYNDNIMQKSTTVPSSLTTVATSNGIEENKPLLNGSKTTESITENKENIAELVIDDKLINKQQQMPAKVDDLNGVTIITEEIPAAPQVILPVVNGSADVVNGSDVNRNIPTKPEVRDGHYFLKILKNETDRLISLAEKVEAQLEEKKTVLADDVLGYLRSASGKARLLANQKMQQFEGLCHKNINQVAGEPFPTTTEDLQGFWDMVMLQVTQIDELFAELEELKANNWVIQEKPIPDVTDSTAKPKKLVVKKAVSANAEAQRKQREATRKQMIDAKRKAMRMKQSQQQTEQGIEIFVPESS